MADVAKLVIEVDTSAVTRAVAELTKLQAVSKQTEEVAVKAAKAKVQTEEKAAKEAENIAKKESAEKMRAIEAAYTAAEKAAKARTLAEEREAGLRMAAERRNEELLQQLYNFKLAQAEKTAKSRTQIEEKEAGLRLAAERRNEELLQQLHNFKTAQTEKNEKARTALVEKEAKQRAQAEVQAARQIAQAEEQAAKATKTTDFTDIFRNLLNAREGVEGMIGGFLRLGTGAYLTGRALQTTAGIVQGLVQPFIDNARAIETMQASYSVLLGNETSGRGMVTWLQNLSSQLPVSMKEMSNGTRTMLGFGVALQDVKTILPQLAALSQGSSEAFGHLAVVVGQVQAQGRMYMQDLRQFTNAGVPMIEALAEITGAPASAIAEMIKDGEIGISETMKALQMMTEEGGRFHGMLEKSAATLNGELTRAANSFARVAAEMGKPIADAFKFLVSGVNANLSFGLVSASLSKLSGGKGSLSESEKADLQAAIQLRDAYLKSDEVGSEFYSMLLKIGLADVQKKRGLSNADLLAKAPGIGQLDNTPAVMSKSDWSKFVSSELISFEKTDLPLMESMTPKGVMDQYEKNKAFNEKLAEFISKLLNLPSSKIALSPEEKIKLDEGIKQLEETREKALTTAHPSQRASIEESYRKKIGSLKTETTAVGFGPKDPFIAYLRTLFRAEKEEKGPGGKTPQEEFADAVAKYRTDMASRKASFSDLDTERMDQEQLAEEEYKKLSDFYRYWETLREKVIKLQQEGVSAAQIMEMMARAYSTVWEVGGVTVPADKPEKIKQIPLLDIKTTLDEGMYRELNYLESLLPLLALTGDEGSAEVLARIKVIKDNFLPNMGMSVKDAIPMEWGDTQRIDVPYDYSLGAGLSTLFDSYEKMRPDYIPQEEGEGGPPGTVFTAPVVTSLDKALIDLQKSVTALDATPFETFIKGLQLTGIADEELYKIDELKKKFDELSEAKAIKEFKDSLESLAKSTLLSTFRAFGEDLYNMQGGLTSAESALADLAQTAADSFSQLVTSLGLKLLIIDPANPVGWVLLGIGGIIQVGMGFSEASQKGLSSSASDLSKLKDYAEWYMAAEAFNEQGRHTAGITGFAQGGVPGGLSRYRNGVYSTPRFFSFADGGVFGEAGPEAIMPLTRTSSGDLGVKSVSSPIQIVVNNNASVQVETQETVDTNGMRQITLTIEKIVENAVSKGKLDRVFGSRYGNRYVGKKVGV